MSYLQCLFCGFLNDRSSPACSVCRSLLSPRSHVTSLQLLQNMARRRPCTRCRRALLPIGTCTFCTALHASTPVGSAVFSMFPGTQAGEASVWPVDTFSSLIQPVLPMQSAPSAAPRALSLVDLLSGDVVVEREDMTVGNMSLRFNRISNMLTSLINDERESAPNGPLSAEARARHVIQPTEAAPDAQCPVCIETFGTTPLTELLQLPCRHRYHSNCINSWFERRDTCPLCRISLNADSS
jgi:hypothetical protein